MVGVVHANFNDYIDTVDNDRFYVNDYVIVKDR